MTVEQVKDWLDTASDKSKQELVDYLSKFGYYLIEPKSIGDQQKVEHLIEELKTKTFSPYV